MLQIALTLVLKDKVICIYELKRKNATKLKIVKRLKICDFDIELWQSVVRR